MDLKTAKILTFVSMLLSVTCAVASILFFGPEDPLRIYFGTGAFVLMGIALVFLFGFCRCPWCGRRIISGLMKVKVCPFCHRDLETGLRVKNHKKR